MASGYTNSSGVDFDDLFEPEVSGNGATASGYERSPGVNLRYAKRAVGSKISNVGYEGSDGSDLSYLWAGKGTVSYLVSPPSYNGRSTTTACESVKWYNTLYADTYLNLKSDGTWTITSTTTNYVADDVYNYNQYGITNYPNGRTFFSGNWAKNPASGIGSSYEVNASQTSYEHGWKDYPVVDGGDSTAVYHPGSFRGPGTVNTDGASGLGTGRSLGSTVKIGLVFKVAGSSGMSSYADNNGGLSWYNKATFSVKILNSSVTSINVTGSCSFYNELRWGDSNWPTPINGGGSGGGGGTGVGGCVVVDSIMFDGFMAGARQVGKDLLVTDPYLEEASNSTLGQVLLSTPELQPCVRITTEDGVQLDCSTTAPIPTRTEGFIIAPGLYGLEVPVAYKDDLDPHSTKFKWSKVVDVRHIGERYVQRIYVENRCFWASMDGQYFILHHNLKKPKIAL